MKACNNCGTPLNEGSSFCTNCGTSVSAIAKEPVSVGGWIGRSLIPFIPVVGGIVYLIMLFIWSGDTKKEATFRNWAKAQLIVMAVAIVLVIIAAVIFGTVAAEIVTAMNY